MFPFVTKISIHGDFCSFVLKERDYFITFITKKFPNLKYAWMTFTSSSCRYISALQLVREINGMKWANKLANLSDFKSLFKFIVYDKDDSYDAVSVFSIKHVRAVQDLTFRKTGPKQKLESHWLSVIVPDIFDFRPSPSFQDLWTEDSMLYTTLSGQK